MEVHWDVNEFDGTLIVDETMVVDETFEELEQSILSILSEEDSGLTLSPIPKTSLQNVHSSDLKNSLCFSDPEAPVNDINSSQQNSPVLLSKEIGGKRHLSDSGTDCKSSLFVTKRAKVNFQSLNSSPTSRSPRKIFTTLNQKENFTTVSDNIHANGQSTIKNIFNKNLNSFKISEDKNKTLMSLKLPLKPKNYDALIKPNFSDAINTPSLKYSIPCLPQSVNDITAIENINNQIENKYTQLVLPSSVNNFDHSLNVNNPQYHIPIPNFNEQIPNSSISAECDKVLNNDSQINQLGQTSTINDFNKSIPAESQDSVKPSVSPNGEVCRSDTDLQTTKKDIIPEQFLNESKLKNATSELSHENIPNSNSFTPIDDANSTEEDPDILSLFADDDLEIIDEIVDEDALLDFHDTNVEFSKRNDAQTFNPIKQTDISADPKNKHSCEISSSSQTILKNVNLSSETSSKLVKNDNFEPNDDDQDEISIFVVEELEFFDAQHTENNKNIDDNKTVNVGSKKHKDNLNVFLPITENKTTTKSRMLETTVALIKSDKSDKICSIPNADAGVQEKLESDYKVLNEVGKQSSKNTDPKNAAVVESTTEVKKVYKPFKSADPEENKDIDHPEWEQMKMLTTDKERYEVVRSRWKSKTVPNPNRDLTYHSFRKRRVQESSVSDNSVKHGQKRIGDNSLRKPPAKRTRTNTVPCTYLIDNKIACTRQQFSKEAQTVRQTYAAESESLYAMRVNAESQLVSQMRNPYYNYQPYNNLGYDKFQFLSADHEIAENALILKHDNQMRVVQSSCDAKLNSLNKARQEIEKFCKFYKGLSQSADGENDPTFITENQMEELNQMENVFTQFNKYYQH